MTPFASTVPVAGLIWLIVEGGGLGEGGSGVVGVKVWLMMGVRSCEVPFLAS